MKHPQVCINRRCKHQCYPAVAHFKVRISSQLANQFGSCFQIPAPNLPGEKVSTLLAYVYELWKQYIKIHCTRLWALRIHSLVRSRVYCIYIYMYINSFTYINTLNPTAYIILCIYSTHIYISYTP